MAKIERIERDTNGALLARVEGREDPVKDLCVARCFPWSRPHGYISLHVRDGEEIALLKSLDELDAASRSVVEEELRKMVFTPRILKVLDHRRDFGISSIQADTDRGSVTFQIRSRDDVRLLSPTRAIFRDADGNVYEVPDLTALDARSRNWLMEYF